MSVINSYTGSTFATDYKIAIIASEFNGEIVKKLLQDAKNTLAAHQIENLTIVKVPGAFELAFAARQVAVTHDVVIVLGVVIRGETPHFDYVCDACIEGVNRVMHDLNTPIVFGVLTTNTIEQAWARANGTTSDDQTQKQAQGGGAYAANVALRMASLTRQLKQAQEV